jgi:hypothetical protein
LAHLSLSLETDNGITSGSWQQLRDNIFGRKSPSGSADDVAAQISEVEG